MPLLDTLPVGPDTARWLVWSTSARLVVTDPAALAEARQVVEAVLSAVDKAGSRFRPDSELRRLDQSDSPVRISPLLAELVGAALDAARETDGDVDPTVGSALEQLGYDRDVLMLAQDGAPVPTVVRHVPGWQRVRLDGHELTVPRGVLLDFGATAKAFAADRCARMVAAYCGVGVLVSLGGDIATAGGQPAEGWQVLVGDGPGQPHNTVTLATGGALATSSTLSRTWRRGGRLLHHIIDPRTCQPADPVWRTVSVAAHSCVAANTLSTATLVRGLEAPAWLRALGVPARLVAANGDVLTLGDWPGEAGP